MSRAVDRVNARRDEAERKLTEALAELGALSPEGIRDRLVADGIRGQRRSCGTCPIALWLQSRTGDDDVLVGSDDAMVEGRVVPLPNSVKRFISRFDGDMYGELVRSHG